MKLWTIQPLNVLEIIENTGYFVCDPEQSEGYSWMSDSYDWLISQMDLRFPHPDGVKLPLWAWHTRDWKRELVLSDEGLGTPGTQYACIEFEIEDSQVLLSDYNSWHYVLNQSWLEDSKDEAEFDANMEWFDSQPYGVRKRLTVDSWQKIFDVKPYECDWYTKGRYVQATFWALQEDMIRNIQIFTAQ